MVAAATYLHHGAVLGLEQPVEALDLLRCSFLVNRHLQQAARQWYSSCPDAGQPGPASEPLRARLMCITEAACSEHSCTRHDS